MKNRKNIEIGALGEEIARKFLENKGFSVIEMNYRRKWGEIDIVSKKDKLIHFIEVKSVEGCIDGGKFPEENVHEKKLKRLSRAIQTYLSENKEDDTEWQLDVVAVFLDIEKKKADVRLTENVFS